MTVRGTTSPPKSAEAVLMAVNVAESSNCETGDGGMKYDTFPRTSVFPVRENDVCQAKVGENVPKEAAAVNATVVNLIVARLRIGAKGSEVTAPKQVPEDGFVELSTLELCF